MTVSDQRIEEFLGNLLRWGVILSASVVLAGGIVYLARHSSQPVEFHVFRGEPVANRSLSGILAGVRQAKGRSLIQLGLILLVATPVARVVFSALGFALERDRVYVVVTLIVLGTLLFSLLGS